MAAGLTAVIPTHNRPTELRRAVESVLAQTADAQLVIVDDGSDPPVDPGRLPSGTKVVRHDDPLGPAAARNAGAEVAESDWLGFLDDDDLWLPHKTELVLNAIAAHPRSEVVISRTALLPDRLKGEAFRIEVPLERVLYQQPPSPAGVVVRRDIHEAVRFDESMRACEDIDYLIRLGQHSHYWLEMRQTLSQIGARADGSAIDSHSRIEGRLMLMEKHRGLIESDPVAHSFYLTRLGHLYRLAGRREDARKTFLAAVKVRPLSGLGWKGLARTIPIVR